MDLVKIKKPSTIFSRQRSMAKIRNIEWHLTFEEWWNIWEQSGKYEQRGRGAGKYCMSRKNDTGPYEVGNVYIQTIDDNNREAHKGKPQSPDIIAKRVAKIKGVKHSAERRLANSLGQLKSTKNVFVNKLYDCSNRIPWNKSKTVDSID